MDRQERQRQVEQHLAQVQIVTAMIGSSVALLAGVTFLLAATGKLRAVAADSETIQLVLAPLAVALLGLAPALKRALFKRAEAEGFDGDTGRWLAAHRRSVIVAAALREGTALLGFFMSLLSGQARWSYLFSALALVTLILDWPKAGELGEE